MCKKIIISSFLLVVFILIEIVFVWVEKVIATTKINNELYWMSTKS